MPANSLYTDLSDYYDLLCADIDYPMQSQGVRRLHQLFGDKGQNHLDLACGTGPHVRHFIDFGYHSRGLDINQPMLDRAKLRCPEAQFSLQNMYNFEVSEKRVTDIVLSLQFYNFPIVQPQHYLLQPQLNIVITASYPYNFDVLVIQMKNKILQTKQNGFTYFKF